MTNHLCLPRTVLPLKVLYPGNPPFPGTTKQLGVLPEEEKHQAQSEGYRHVPGSPVAKTALPMQGARVRCPVRELDVSCHSKKPN